MEVGNLNQLLTTGKGRANLSGSRSAVCSGASVKHGNNSSDGRLQSCVNGEWKQVHKSSEGIDGEDVQCEEFAEQERCVDLRLRDCGQIRNVGGKRGDRFCLHDTPSLFASELCVEGVFYSPPSPVVYDPGSRAVSIFPIMTQLFAMAAKMTLILSSLQAGAEFDNLKPSRGLQLEVVEQRHIEAGRVDSSASKDKV